MGTDSSNAEWPNVATDGLTPQGQGTSDTAGLPVGPLLANADEVIGTGTPTGAERDRSASHSIHAESYAELLGVAGDADRWRGELQRRCWRPNFPGDRELAGYAAVRLHDERCGRQRSTG